MSLKHKKARDLMVENQLRPNKIKDPIILDVFKNTLKEDYLPKENNVIPYMDSDINIVSHRGYLKNLHLAQLINSAEIEKKHKIMHIGSLTGYVTSMLANLCEEVIAIETDKEIRSILEENILRKGIKNIKIVKGSLKEGYMEDGPYDRIFIDSPIKDMQSVLLDQLNGELGKIIMIQKINNEFNQAFKITKNKNNFSKEYLFDVFSNYELYLDKEEFIF